MNRFTALLILTAFISYTTTGHSQELWNNAYAHAFQKSENDDSPLTTMISVRANTLYNNQITLLAKVWPGSINVDPDGSEDGLFESLDEPNGFRRFALIAYDPDGSFLWRKTISSANANTVSGMHELIGSADGVMSTGPDGTLHILSTFIGQVDVSSDGSGSYINSVPFGPDQLEVHSIYTARYNQNGDLLGANVIASHNSQFGSIYARAITTSNDGSSYALLSYNTDIILYTPDGDINFGSRPEAPNLYEILLVKINAQGEVEWTKQYAGDTTGIPLQGIDTDNDGNVTFTGRWSGVLDLNPDNPGGLTMEVTNLSQWGVFWSKFTPDGTWLAGDAYTRSGPLINLRDFHLAPDGTAHIVLNNAGFNILSSGQEVEPPTGTFGTRILQYAPNGNLNMIRDNIPNGSVFSDVNGNLVNIVLWSANSGTVPVDFNEEAGDPVLFEELTGEYRFMLVYDNDLNLTRAAAINLLPSATGGHRGFAIPLNEDEVILTIPEQTNNNFAPGLSSENNIAFNSNGFVQARYHAQPTSVQAAPANNSSAPVLYPNPSSGQIQLELAYPNETATALLTDLHGKLLLNISGDQPTLQQQVNQALVNLSAGLFLLSIHQREDRHAIKLIRLVE